MTEESSTTEDREAEEVRVEVEELVTQAEPEPAAEDRAKPDTESFWSSFTRADIRLLVLTFAGTLAANIVTVMLVAIAILAARSWGQPNANDVLYPLANIPLLAMFMIFARIYIRSAKTKASRRFWWVVGAGSAAITLLYVFTLLGYAVGVK